MATTKQKPKYDPPLTSANVIDHMNRAIDRFNGPLKQLVRIAAVKAGPSFMDKQQQIFMALKYEDTVVIRGVGSYIGCFEQQLRSGDIDFFMNLQYDKLIQKDPGWTDKDVKHISELLKGSWKNMSVEERQSIISKIVDMLDAYEEYERLQFFRSTGKINFRTFVCHKTNIYDKLQAELLNDGHDYCMYIYCGDVVGKKIAFTDKRDKYDKIAACVYNDTKAQENPMVRLFIVPLT